MASDLIRKSRTLELLKYYERQYDGIGRAIRAFEQMETVDAVEVVHGRWRMVKIGLGASSISFAKCSACGRKMNVSHYGSLYCGLCGAKMDGGDKE